MRNYLIRLLFRLLGSDDTKLMSISSLFGTSTGGHESRKKRWERALARLWKDKDMIDYLYYQAESDKEKIFQGLISPDLSRGARIRTLFLVYSANIAHKKLVKDQRSSSSEKDDSDAEIQKVETLYKKIVSIK